MNDKAMRLENPVRLAELKPAETLKRIGLEDGHVLCDIGAGSGIFTIPAARITGGAVYAVELRQDMLDIVTEKARAEGLGNVARVLSDGGGYYLDDCCADIALAVTVLHEVPDKTAFAAEMKRILKPGGKMAVIEFHKRETPMGPPVTRRLSEDEVRTVFTDAGFAESDAFSLGDNFYCLVFRTT